MLSTFEMIIFTNAAKKSVSPDPGIIRSSHLDGVQRAVKVHNVQRYDRVFLPSLDRMKTSRSDRVNYIAAVLEWESVCVPLGMDIPSP